MSDEPRCTTLTFELDFSKVTQGSFCSVENGAFCFADVSVGKPPRRLWAGGYGMATKSECRQFADFVRRHRCFQFGLWIRGEYSYFQKLCYEVDATGPLKIENRDGRWIVTFESLLQTIVLQTPKRLFHPCSAGAMTPQQLHRFGTNGDWLWKVRL